MHDGGAGFKPAGSEPRGADGGFGLFLVERMASRWGVETRDGTRVWFELDLATGATERVGAAAAWLVGGADRRGARSRRSTSPRATRVRAAACYLLPVLAIAMRAGASVAIVGRSPRSLLALASAHLERQRRLAAAARSPSPPGRRSPYFGAREREAAIAARGAAEAERRQLRLLADAARITDGAADIDEALRRLVDLLVPDLADAAWIDVLAARRRAAPARGARSTGPTRAELEAWLLARGALRARASSRRRRARCAARAASSPSSTTACATRSIHDERGRRADGALRRCAGRWRCRSAPSGGPLGRARARRRPRPGARYGPDELAFAELLVGRAGLALANAQLVDRADARRSGGSTASSARSPRRSPCTTRGARSSTRTTPRRGCSALPGVARGARPPQPGELAARFEIRDPDGAPVAARGAARARRVLAASDAEPLLTRSVVRATGELRWLLTKATPLRRRRRASRWPST